MKAERSLDLSAAEASSAPPAPRKVLFSAMKNEAPFVLEWIAYHKVIGFDEIVICSNPSNDGMEEILAALAEAAEIRHLRTEVPVGGRAQAIAAEAFNRQVGHRNGDWYAWLDADEFLNVHVGNRSLDALLASLGDRQCALINWRVFGSNGQRRFRGRFIDEAFVGAAPPGFRTNLQQKALFRFSSALAGFARRGHHRPLAAAGSHWTCDDVVTGNGGSLSVGPVINRLWLEGADKRGTAHVAAHEFGWTLAQINHYMVRTPEFFALKQVRGRAWRSEAEGEISRYSPQYLEENDCNEAEDRSILHWQDRVTAEIARLRACPGVAAAVERSDRLVADILKEMDPILATSAAEAAVLPVPSSVPHAVPETLPPPDFRLTLPPDEAAFVISAYEKAGSVLEYGSGGSTVLAARLGKPVISVESDRDWADRLSAHLTTISDRAQIHHADIGPTKRWGKPSRPRFHGRFHRYALSVWDRPDLGDPDLVLIDGRFRAACLAAVLLRARRPTTVLFDDYEGRPFYHSVEKLARKEETVGRMARFTVTPGAIPPEMLTEAIGWFSDPR